MQNNNVSLGNKINDFVQRNRRIIFISMGVIIFLIAGFVVTVSLNEFFNKKSMGEIEELSRKFTEIKSSLNDGENAAVVQELITDISNFAKSKRGFAAGRAWSIVGQIHAERKEWPQAEEAYRSAAKAAPKTYMAPAALFNAAAASEEQGNLEQALELYMACVSHPFEYPAAVRAQFAAGRINEKLNDIPAALDAYRGVLSKWPHLTVWANLANSRIIVLDSSK
ncbi:MAG: tetratricopeptide repeat protein [Treponema sp.]|nr:tetratricopeptide repeat protein [Treponema sp.]